MTSTEFLELLKSLNFTPDWIDSNDYHPAIEMIPRPNYGDAEEREKWDKLYRQKENDYLKELGEWKVVSQWGGEGQGDSYGHVVYFPTHDIYVRADGWYASYNGSDMSGACYYVVKPVEKTITVYERTTD